METRVRNPSEKPSETTERRVWFNERKERFPCFRCGGTCLRGGIMTSASKEFKMHRSTADRLRKGVEERIRSYNADNRRSLCVTGAVIFGSYVNDPGKEMLSDLDVGLEMGNRFEGETHRRCADEERIRTRRATPSEASSSSRRKGARRCSPARS